MAEAYYPVKEQNQVYWGRQTAREEGLARNHQEVRRHLAASPSEAVVQEQEFGGAVGHSIVLPHCHRILAEMVSERVD